jgi:hypothetical protein
VLESDVNPFRRPRHWARLVGAALVLLATWLLVVPVTAVYISTDTGPPREVATVYSWWTSEQDVIYSDARGYDLTHLEHYFDQDRLANGIRLDCGNIFGAGRHEKLEAPDGPAVCSRTTTPRRIIGLSLLALGVLALLAAVKLPADSARYSNSYRQPYRQRRLLERGR